MKGGGRREVRSKEGEQLLGAVVGEVGRGVKLPLLRLGSCSPRTHCCQSLSSAEVDGGERREARRQEGKERSGSAMRWGEGCCQGLSSAEQRRG